MTGSLAPPNFHPRPGDAPSPEIREIVEAARGGCTLSESQIVRLFEARGPDARASSVGDTVSYIVTRNINYMKVCGFRCAFSKGKTSENLRGRPYDLDLAEIRRRAREA